MHFLLTQRAERARIRHSKERERELKMNCNLAYFGSTEEEAPIRGILLQEVPELIDYFETLRKEM